MQEIDFKLNEKESIKFLIDKEDYDLIENKKLTFRKKKNGRIYIYVLCIKDNGEEYYVSLHRMIYKKHNLFKRGYEIDHKDRNPLNNQKSNLRLATGSQNRWNVGKVNDNNYTSTYKGVRKAKHKKWTAQIGYKNKHYYIGRFVTEREAAIAYNIKAKELFGEFACLNNINNVTIKEEEKIIKLILNKRKHTTINKYITYNNLTLTPKQWEEKTGIKSYIIRCRLKDGWSIEDALNIVTKEVNKNITLEYNGEIKTLKDWAKIYNIEYPTLWNRVVRQKLEAKEALKIKEYE